MTTIDNIIPASLLIDRENATIPYSTETVRLNERINRGAVPFSKIGQGKFRKLFNRHTATYLR